MSRDAREISAAATEPLTDQFARVLAARFAMPAPLLAAESTTAAQQWRWLHELCNDTVLLRRGDHSAERLRLEREQMEFARQKDREGDRPLAWASDPAVQEV